jgi:glycosyltransferase involved in cell wall biosynthesis
VSAPVRHLRLALLGSRGIPARYGGYETLMEELATRLAAAGHEVTVYCRSHFTSPALASHRGVRLVVLPTLRTKYLDTPVHTLLSCLHASRESYDAALVVNGANALFVPLLRLGGVPTALHVDGIERRRAKWGPAGRAVYALSERLACLVPDALVTDAEVIREHYLARYGADSTVITYGVDAPDAGTATLDRLGLAPGGYLLYVSRFEPENNPHRVAAAWREVRGDLRLVMVGGAPYAGRFIRGFTADADPRILFPGPIYGVGYHELMAHCLAYVHATEVGGTHPALVEALGHGACVLVHDTPENRETAGDAALTFDAAVPASLAALVERVAADPAERQRLRERARARARQRFDWGEITRQYTRLFRALAGEGGVALRGLALPFHAPTE